MTELTRPLTSCFESGGLPERAFVGVAVPSKARLDG